MPESHNSDIPIQKYYQKTHTVIEIRHLYSGKKLIYPVEINYRLKTIFSLIQPTFLIFAAVKIAVINVMVFMAFVGVSQAEEELMFKVFPVYTDANSPDNHFMPTGWMGDYGDLAFDDADLSHTYSTGGIYNISITGELPYILFDSSLDLLKIIDIIQWGSISIKNWQNSYFGCSNMNITATDKPDLSGCLFGENSFRGCTLANPDTTKWTPRSLWRARPIARMAPI